MYLLKSEVAKDITGCLLAKIKDLSRISRPIVWSEGYIKNSIRTVSKIFEKLSAN